MFADRCAFAPSRPHEGGLLVVDDADEKLLTGAQNFRQLLEEDNRSAILFGCSRPCWDPFDGAIKVVNIELPPLSAAEAADLFLRRCHRPLTMADLLVPEALADHHPDRVVPRDPARRLLEQPLLDAFQGDPGHVRRTAARVTPETPP